MDSRVGTGLGDIAARDWDALVTDGSPFLRHAFLHGLEETGCVGADSGWESVPLLLSDARGLAAAAPVYLKQHS